MPSTSTDETTPEHEVDTTDALDSNLALESDAEEVEPQAKDGLQAAVEMRPVLLCKTPRSAECVPFC